MKCHIDKFWQEKIDWKEAGDITPTGELVVREKGQHFVVGDENAKGAFRGFAGRRFRFEFTSGPHKGKKVVTTNLWFQGDIPQELRDKLFNNAVRIEG